MTLVVDRVAKSFRKRGVISQVLTNVTAVFEPGQSIGILGAPKSGKSTLMRILAGEARPDSGRVLRDARVSFLVGSNVGRMGTMSVQEAIAFMARLYGFRTREIVDFVVEFGELEHILRHQMDTLPKDDRTRLLFTLSYALPFDIYLADESVVAGPQPFQDQCSALVAERCKTSGLIFATRKVHTLRAFADLGGVLHDGELHLFPSAEEAIEAYEALNPLSRLYEQMPDAEEDEDEGEGRDAERELF